jgi:hypothetical protein
MKLDHGKRPSSWADFMVHGVKRPLLSTEIQKPNHVFLQKVGILQMHIKPEYSTLNMIFSVANYNYLAQL